MGPVSRSAAEREIAGRFAALRQYQRNGSRSPHKPLLVLLALGLLAHDGSSSLSWPAAEPVLAGLIAEFGPASRTGRAQSAAYPFTRLRADGVWVLDHDVPMDLVGPLAQRQVTGRFEPSVEDALRADPALAASVARTLVLSNFPDTVAPDVLQAVGLDPDAVLGGPDGGQADRAYPPGRRRDPAWRFAVLQAWDRQCAFCGYDGQLAGATAGLDAAHVRWFSFGGPDELDNGLALCTTSCSTSARSALTLTCECRSQQHSPPAPRPGGRCTTCKAGSWHRGPAPPSRPPGT